MLGALPIWVPRQQIARYNDAAVSLKVVDVFSAVVANTSGQIKSIDYTWSFLSILQLSLEQ